MEVAEEIKITKVTNSRISAFDINNLGFGKNFTDHMLVADYKDGQWQDAEIVPYGPIEIMPALSSLHYGQSIFEGIKGYKTNSGEAVIFRPYDNFKRFNRSAARMNMPEIPEEIFIGGLQQLISLEQAWIPALPDYSLYIRPFMFSTDNFLGVRPSDTYKFMIILSPSGPYFYGTMKIKVEDKYTRAAPGGAGFSKNAGNYAGSMLAATEASKLGYDQVLWTDAFEHKWLQEVGMMNLFFIINGVAVTPSLSEGTILEGVTRNSVITLLQEMGVKVEERMINIDEVVAAYKNGLVTEVFGTGTAAVIAPVSRLNYMDLDMEFDTNNFPVSNKVKAQLSGIRHGLIEDTHGWMFKV